MKILSGLEMKIKNGTTTSQKKSSSKNFKVYHHFIYIHLYK